MVPWLRSSHPTVLDRAATIVVNQVRHLAVPLSWPSHVPLTLPACGLPCSSRAHMSPALSCGVLYGAFSAPRPARVGGLAHDHSADRVPQLPPAHAARRVRALRHGPRQLVPENAGRTPRPAQVIDDTERPVAIAFHVAIFLKEDRRRRDPRHADGARNRLGKKRWRGGPRYGLNNSIQLDDIARPKKTCDFLGPAEARLRCCWCAVLALTLTTGASWHHTARSSLT